MAEDLWWASRRTRGALIGDLVTGTFRLPHRCWRSSSASLRRKLKFTSRRTPHDPTPSGIGGLCLPTFKKPFAAIAAKSPGALLLQICASNLWWSSTRSFRPMMIIRTRLLPEWVSQTCSQLIQLNHYCTVCSTFGKPLRLRSFSDLPTSNYSRSWIPYCSHRTAHLMPDSARYWCSCRVAVGFDSCFWGCSFEGAGTRTRSHRATFIVEAQRVRGFKMRELEKEPDCLVSICCVSFWR